MKGSSYHLPAEAGSSPQSSPELARWVVFCLDTARYALPLAVVERIVWAVQVTPLPLAPPSVLGVIDVEGRIFPVFNLRHKFRLPERPIELRDQFLIARTLERTVALAIDRSQGLIEHPTTTIVDAASIAPELEHIRGVIQHEDGMVLIHDLEQFLSADEARALEEAMNPELLHAD